jgi:hypothetical protein
MKERNVKIEEERNEENKLLKCINISHSPTFVLDP